MKTSTQFSKAGWSLAAIASGLILASAATNAGVIFQADFNGPGGGTGGSNDLVTLGGTGAVVADGVNVKATIINTNPFAPGGGNYLEVQRLTTGGGGQYSPVLFTFAANSNSWDAWQGPNITDPVTGTPDVVLHGALDFFFRVNTNSGTGINDTFSIRTLDQFSWSDGGNGMSLRFNGQNNGSMIFQIQNAGWSAGNNPFTAQNAIVNANTSGGNVAYYQQYDDIDMNMTLPGGGLLTNGVVYHAALSFSTDTNGLITAEVYLAQGTGPLDPVNNLAGWATFNLIATNILDWSGATTSALWTNQPWNFGVGWAADGGPFVADYGSVRIYNSAPTSFAALPGTSSTISSAAPQTNVVFEADFNGPGGGTGGNANLVALGGTGAIVADGVNVKATITNANPFTPGSGNYLEVQRLTTSGGGQYSPVLFTFAANSNSWDAWQGPNITDPVTGTPDVVLHGALDFFFRVNTNSGTGINDTFSIRTLDQFSWSDGGNGMSLRFNGQNNGSMIFQIQNAGWSAGNNPVTAQNAIVNANTSGGNVAYYQQYDDIDMNMTLPDGGLMTNGVVYHAALSFNTDTNGLITTEVYLAQGTGPINPVNNLAGWATFNLIATNILDWSGATTSALWTNQPWNFGVGWAADGGPFVADYGSVRIYNSAPASFSALPAPLKFFPPLFSQGQIGLSWSGSGRLQSAPTVQGPWTFVTPAPASPYSASAQGNRFYRLVGQ